MSAPSSLRLRGRGLTIAAGPNIVCQHLDVRVQAGSLVHVRGASGRGKSTFLRAMLGLAAVAAGTVRRFATTGARIRSCADGDVSAWRANDVGVVLQHNNLFDELTVHDHLRLAGATPPLTDTLLTAFALHDRLHARARTLSGGEQRRVAVARALCRTRGLLVLDEPTEGLDADNARCVWTAVQNAMRSGAGVLVASHDAALAELLPTTALLLGELPQ